MPSEVVCDITLKWLAAILGKGALGKWRAPYRCYCLDSEPGSSDPQWVSSRRYNHAVKGCM